MPSLKCGNCGEVNSHYNRFCPFPRGICHFCKKGVHKKKNCPYYLWDLFKRVNPEVDNDWKITLKLCKKKFNKNWDTTYEDDIFSDWPDLIGKKKWFFEKLSYEIETQKYRYVDLDFIVKTINFYNDIIRMKNITIESWVEFLNRIYFIRKCLENEMNQKNQ